MTIAQAINSPEGLRAQAQALRSDALRSNSLHANTLTRQADVCEATAHAIEAYGEWGRYRQSRGISLLTAAVFTHGLRDDAVRPQDLAPSAWPRFADQVIGGMMIATDVALVLYRRGKTLIPYDPPEASEVPELNGNRLLGILDDPGVQAAWLFMSEHGKDNGGYIVGVDTRLLRTYPAEARVLVADVAHDPWIYPTSVDSLIQARSGQQPRRVTSVIAFYDAKRLLTGGDARMREWAGRVAEFVDSVGEESLYPRM